LENGNEEERDGRYVEDMEELRNPPREIHVPLSMRGRLLLLQAAFLAMVVLATNAVIMRTTNESLDLGPNGSQTLQDTHVLLRDDFDLADDYWLIEKVETGTIGYRDGKAVLRIGKTQQGSSIQISDLGRGGGKRWLQVSTEMRIRVGSESAEVGNGIRCWGFSSGDPDTNVDFLGFSWYSPGSGDDLVGFWAQSFINDSLVDKRPIIGVDVGKWHTYAIHWGEGYAGLFIDGNVVMETEHVTENPMCLLVHGGNWAYTMPPGQDYITAVDILDLEHDAWIQVDHIQVMMTRRQVDEYRDNTAQSLLAAAGIIAEAELGGLEVQGLLEDHAAATDALQMEGYIPGELYQRIGALAGLQELQLVAISDLFRRANEMIQAPGLEEREHRILKADYDRAVEAWQNCDFPRTVIILNRILQRGSKEANVEG
jgi:hypothetical protein